VDVVTGAFSFTGRYVAARLLDNGREVRTLTRRPLGDSPFGDRVRPFPPEALADALRGADTLYNTYWIRAPDRETTFEAAVRRSAALFAAARAAGIRRVVHLSVTNAAAGSPYGYFRGKAAVEDALARSGLSHAVVRPTLVFGDGEVLVNNVAWLLRRLPVFVAPGPGFRLQPVAAEDVAALCVQAAAGSKDVTFDAAGPDVLTFEELVRLVRAAIRSRAVVRRGDPRTALALVRLLGLLTRETIVTPAELHALRDDLLTSADPPRGHRRIHDWLAEAGPTLGRTFAAGERRPWRQPE
jgi:NADH dehydrogenase